MEREEIIQSKYKMLFIYLLLVIPIFIWAWINTTEHMYNLLPASVIIIGVIKILVEG